MTYNVGYTVCYIYIYVVWCIIYGLYPWGCSPVFWGSGVGVLLRRPIQGDIGPYEGHIGLALVYPS